MQAIVCISENWGIGIDGELLFHISADLKRFRELTTGKTVIYGRRTLATFPGGKPLEGRRNIILTHNETPIPGAELAHTPEEAVALAGNDAIVIGGASVYRQTFPWLDRVYVTQIDACPESDSFFPDLDADPGWFVAEDGPWQSEDGVRYRFRTYCCRQAAAPEASFS